jgi:hypothetical protein
LRQICRSQREHQCLSLSRRVRRVTAARIEQCLGKYATEKAKDVAFGNPRIASSSQHGSSPFKMAL